MPVGWCLGSSPRRLVGSPLPQAARHRVPDDPPMATSARLIAARFLDRVHIVIAPVSNRVPTTEQLPNIVDPQIAMHEVRRTSLTPPGWCLQHGWQATFVGGQGCRE